MTAFIHYVDPLRVSLDNSPAGANWYDNRSAWHTLDEITFDDGGLVGTQWYRDNGPIGMDSTLQEPRAFCIKGGCHWTFTGTTLIIRVNVAYSWYTGTGILIDGVLPSTLGLLTAQDTISSDAATYALNSDSYVDVVVADGLTDTLHTVALLSDSADTTKFFSIAGYKVGHLDATAVAGHTTYIISTEENIIPNKGTLTITNKQLKPIAAIVVEFPATLMGDDGSPIPDLTSSQLGPGETLTQVFSPAYDPPVVADVYDYGVTMTANYYDAAGVIDQLVSFYIAADSVELTFHPSSWIMDSATPGDLPRAFVNAQSTSGTPWTLELTFSGDALDLTVQRSAGWGEMGIYDGPTLGASLLETADCSVDDGGALHTYNLTGFGVGSHTVYLRKTVNDALFIVYVSAVWDQTLKYTEVSESFNLTVEGQQAIPMLVGSFSVGDYEAVFNPPDEGTHDYVNVPVRTNDDYSYSEVLTRFPTFAVCYQAGYRDTLKEYDVLIVDPLGARVADVAYWQSLGIKVFGYVASLEEVGFYENRYDFATALAPRPGAGPGGYSLNYMFTQHPVAGPPDTDGVWAAYFMDPRAGTGWYERVRDYYLPQVFNGSEIVTEENVTTHTEVITAGSRIVFDTALSPIDADQDITLTTLDGMTTYVRFSDYTYDVKTGAFVLSPTISPPVTTGDHLLISYTRKGHSMDGLFWDVPDVVDVYSGAFPPYPSEPTYAPAAVVFMNDIADDIYASYGDDKKIIFNRGFTILNDLMAHLGTSTGNGVMFETWLTYPDDIAHLDTTDYHKITDQASVEANIAFHEQLRALRMRYTFDVYSLNYALPADTALKAYCRQKDAEYGYLSWQTVITLTNPTHNDPIDVPGPPIQTNAFVRYKLKNFP